MEKIEVSNISCQQNKIKKDLDKVEIGWKYVEAQRLQGYKYWTAVADLIDNSIDAKATKVDISYNGRIQSQVDEIVVFDNGTGMDFNTLKESFNLGAKTLHTRSDLGKFGVGGTLGCIALGKNKVTLTRGLSGGDIIGRQLSLDVCKDKNGFYSSPYVPTEEDINYFNEAIGKESTGTMVRLTNLDKLTNNRIPGMVAKTLGHVGSVYYAYLNSANLKICVNEKDVTPADPICWFDPDTIKMGSVNIEHKGVLYNIKSANLINVPRERIPGKNLVQASGIYFERNERLILKHVANGEYLDGFWERDPRKSYFRSMVSFSSDADGDMGIGVKKSGISITDQALMDKLRTVINPCARQAELEYDRKKISSSKEDRNTDLSQANTTLNSASIIAKVNQSGGSNNNTVSGRERLDSVENDVEERAIPPATNEADKFSFEEVEWGPRGQLAILEDGKFKLNTQHPYLSTFYTSASQETRNSVLAWVGAFLMSELEMGYMSSDTQNCSMEDFFSRFEKRLATWVRKS